MDQPQEISNCQCALNLRPNRYENQTAATLFSTF